MDEATAALDQETTLRVENAILNLPSKTCIVVTHRLDASLLQKYDQILVLKNGEVQEQGTFAELMEAEGYLYRLAMMSEA